MNRWRVRLLSLGLLSLRAMMGLGIAMHGYGKVFDGRMEGFAGGVANMGFPMPDFFAWAAALSELVGGILVALGLGTRIAAGFVFLTMTVAAFIVHASDPFSKKELALAYWAVALALMLTGPGPLSLDVLLRRWRSARSKKAS